MAANTDGDSWSETSPVGATETVGAGALEIRSLRAAVRQRLLKEHVAPAASNVGGEHKAGSAVSYIGDYSDAYPTLRPDASTTLTADDLGRVAYNTDDGEYRVLTNHVGPVWTKIASPYSIDPMTGSNDSDGTITFPNGMIMKWGKDTITTDGDNTVEFPAAFPTACFAVMACSGDSTEASYDYQATVHTIIAASFKYRTRIANRHSPVRWFAIGR